jgi:F0F1-type ATP synthase assembly protein I
MEEKTTQPGASGAKRSARRTSGALDGLVQGERMLELAFVLPVSVCVGLFFGYLLDRWLHQHWIEVAGIALGAVAGFIEVFRILRRSEKDSQ